MNVNRIVLLLGLMLAAAWATDAAAAESSLSRSTPEAQGGDSAGILNFVKAADKELDRIHSFMLVRNGKVVAERVGAGSRVGGQATHYVVTHQELHLHRRGTRASRG